MSELRYNYLLDTWVIVAPERKNRPSSFPLNTPSEGEDLSRCPFEPEKLPQGAFSLGNVKVIPNKYPVLKPESPQRKRRKGIYTVLEGFGVHEVVVDTPDHFKHLKDFSLTELYELLLVYQKRSKELYKNKKIKYVLVFRNYKREAGASIAHPHSQIVAMPFIPPSVEKVIERSRNYYFERGICYLCDEVTFELKEKERLLFESASFLAYCPFYSLYPFEVRLIPKFHSASFLDVGERLLRELSELLLILLKRLYSVLNDPPYNLYIHTSPLPASRYEPFFHWYLELVPRLNVPGGLEVGGGLYVNPVSPEEAARLISDSFPNSDSCRNRNVE